jgi:hypothetical protein
MDGLDLLGELGVLPLPHRRAGQVRIEGGTEDLQQRARPGDVTPASSVSMNG